ncbi:MAG: hypothetical protein ACKOLA_08815 [Spartobacteria bacterium]
MMISTRAILFLLLVSQLCPAAEGPDFDSEPWLRPRSMENFKSLLERSPFSLPTAEETTAIAERFELTGAATINETPVVFVLDKNTQNRLMLEKLNSSDNAGKDQLLELFQDADPKKLRASVQIEGQRTEIRFSETSFAPPSGQPMPPQASAPNQPMPPAPPPQPQHQAAAPGQQPPAVQPGNNSNSQPPRRVIRRRVISGQPPAAQSVPGQ